MNTRSTRTAAIPNNDHWDEGVSLLDEYTSVDGQDKSDGKGNTLPWRANSQNQGGVPQLSSKGISRRGHEREQKWQSSYVKLKAFYETHGHCRVQSDTDKKLNLWIKKNRELNGKNELRCDRKQLLEKMGDVLQSISPRKSLQPRYSAAQEQTWKENYARLVLFHGVHGHCQVRRENDLTLSKWVIWQRRVDRTPRGHSPDRKELLNELGVLAYSHNIDLSAQSKNTTPATVCVAIPPQRYLEPKKPTRAPKPTTRMSVTTRPKSVINNHSSSPKYDSNRGQTDLPEGLGLEDFEQQWQANYTKLKVFYDAHGHCLVLCGEDKELYLWVQRQRKDNNKNELPRDHKRLLETLGNEILPSTPSQNQARNHEPLSWQESYARLKAFYETHGHCRVHSSDGKQLNLWVKRQRSVNNAGGLSIDRKHLLEKLGDVLLSPVAKKDQWQENYTKLKAFHDTHGHCRVRFCDDKQLHVWVKRQRAVNNSKVKGLSIHCKQLLEKCGDVLLPINYRTPVKPHYGLAQEQKWTSGDPSLVDLPEATGSGHLHPTHDKIEQPGKCASMSQHKSTACTNTTLQQELDLIVLTAIEPSVDDEPSADKGGNAVSTKETPMKSNDGDGILALSTAACSKLGRSPNIVRPGQELAFQVKSANDPETRCCVATPKAKIDSVNLFVVTAEFPDQQQSCKRQRSSLWPCPSVKHFASTDDSKARPRLARHPLDDFEI